jgi:gliding motility-associated-like protein
MKSFLILLYYLLLTSISSAQAPTVLQSQRNYGGSLSDDAKDFKILADGSMVMLGTSHSNDGDITGHHLPVEIVDIAVIRTNPSGNVIWSRSLGGTPPDDGSTIIPTTDGGFIVAGSTGSPNGDVTGFHGGIWDVWVVKLDISGNIVWQKCYGGSQLDFGSDIIETNGGFIITGNTTSSDGDVVGHHGTNEKEDLWVFKIDNSGNLLWQRCYGGTLADGAFSKICPTLDGAFLLTTITQSLDGDVSNLSNIQDAWILKISPVGTIIWDKCVGGNYGDIIQKTIANSDGTFFLTGYTYADDLPGSIKNGDGWALQLDAAGNTEWIKAFGGSGADYFMAAIKTPDAGYLLAGYSKSTDGIVCQKHLLNEVWLVKLDVGGNTQWSRTYGGNQDDLAKKLALNATGDCVVLSTSNSTDGDISNNKGGNDFWLSRFSFTGKLIYPSLTIRSETDSIVCSGKIIHFVATAVNGGTQPVFQWKLNGGNIGTNNDTLFISNLQSTDVIACELTSNSPCVDVKTVMSNNLSVKVGALTSPKSFLTNDTALCSYQKIELKTNRKFVSYLWSNNLITESITVKQPGLYWLEVTDLFQCTGRDSVVIFPKTCIEGVFIPNAFTPNNDGRNDQFMPIMNADVKQYRFMVYDRWGRIVFETTTLNKGWDGTQKNMPYNTGVFMWQCIYQLEGEEPTSKRGTVLLLR